MTAAAHCACGDVDFDTVEFYAARIALGWHRAPLAQTPAYLDAVPVGQHELDDRGHGQAESAAVEGVRSRTGCSHLEARAVQHGPQSVQAL